MCPLNSRPHDGGGHEDAASPRWSGAHGEGRPLAIVGLDADGDVESLNPAAETLLGIPHANAVGLTMDMLPLPPPLRRHLRRLAGGAAELAERAVHLRFVGPDGRRIAVECTVVPAEFHGARTAICLRVLGYLDAVRQPSRPSASTLEAATRLAAVGAYEWNRGTGGATLSDSFYELHGLEVGDPRLTSLATYDQFVHPDDREILTDLAELGRGGGDPVLSVEYRIIRDDGAVRTMVSTAVFAAARLDAPELIIGTVRDVTDVKRRESGLGLHLALTAAIDDWTEDGWAQLLCRLAGAFECAAATLWVRDGDPPTLACREFWSTPDVDPSNAFGEAIRRQRFQPDEGLPGRVWSARMPLQLSRARRDDPHVRAVEAADARLADAFAFPVVLEDELLAVIELHSGAGEELTPQLAATLSAIGAQLAHFLARRRARLGSSPVSEREREVLQLAAGGASIAAIAENLTLSPSTVKTHLEHIYEKLDVTTRSGAVAQGLRTGLIE